MPQPKSWSSLLDDIAQDGIDAVVVSEGHLDHLASANISPVVVEAGRQLQAFHWAVIDEREF
jgi:hypothetical protein